MTSSRMRLILILLFIGFTNGIQVDVSGEWQNGLGWLINCNWTIPASDKLHSVRLYSTLLTQSENMFLVYRPEVNGLQYGKTISADGFSMKVDCSQTNRESYDGLCTIIVEPHRPPNDTTIRCEVSGERPTFNEGRAIFLAKAFVPPTDAKFENVNVIEDPKRAVLNCTAQGIPAPNLVWTIGEQHTRVNADFTERYWNRSNKIWNSWSSLNYAPQYGEDLQVSCIPEVRIGTTIRRGTPALLNAGAKIVEIIPLLIAAVSIITMIR